MNAKMENLTRLLITTKSTERAALRAEIFQHWLNEKPGTLTARNTYRYDVETLSDGSRIYLLRPARLNKGADFVIVCERFLKFKKGKDRPPKFDDIIPEIKELVSVSEAHRHEFLTALRRIWECEDSRQVLADLKYFKGNFRAERALLLAKWFFIEQDVTYWTDSGRHMLRAAIEDQVGKLP